MIPATSCLVNYVVLSVWISIISMPVLGNKDKIENLMALCRFDHDMFGDKTDYREFLIRTHEQFMKDRKPMFTKPTKL